MVDTSSLSTRLKRSLSMLLAFRGRDSRSQFWPFALLVIGLAMSAFFFAFFPMILSQIFDSLARAEEMARANPNDWVVTRGKGSVQYSYVGSDPAVAAHMMPDLTGLVWATAVISAIVVALLAAAVTRRLHDRDRGGWLGLLPVLLLFGGFALMVSIFGSVSAGSDGDEAGVIGIIMAGFFVNLAYLIALVVLIIQCAMPGTPGPNRYGEAPV